MRLDFRAVWAASANPYMVIDRQLRFVDANPAYLALTGRTLDELVGRTVFEVFPNDPGDPENEPARLLRESFHRVLRTGKPEVLAHLPYRVDTTRGRDLEPRIWSATHSPILDDRGEVAFILQHTEDVTHLGVVSGNVLARAETVQRTNLELDAQLRTMRSLLEQSPGFVAFLRGPDHVFEMTNAAHDQLVGGRKVLGLPFREAFPDLAGEVSLELLDQVYARGEPFCGRGKRLTFMADGVLVERYVDLVYQPIIDEHGTAGVFVQGHDVTDAKRAEVRQMFLTRASEHLAQACDQLDDALRAIAGEAITAFCDAALVDLFEAGSSRRIAAVIANPRHAADARALLAFPIPDHLIAQHPLLGSTAAKPMILPHVPPELVAAYARGPEHAALVREVGVRSALTLPLWHRRQLYGVLVFIQASSGRQFDELDRQTMEELGRVLGAAIENSRLARERTELLAREQLARERAEAANRAKDDFLAMLGHELRNPLAPILTAVQLMRLRGDEESRREQAVIERQAQHMVRIVDDLLDVSKIARGKIELRRELAEVATICAKAIEIVGTLLEAKGHHFTIDVPARGLCVFGDEARLSQVISNLLSNAIRYTEPGGRIHLSAQREDDHIVLRVRDTGIGIDAHMLPRVFDMFVQATQTSDRPEGGLGLGLTLVRRLVELHAGTVAAESDGLHRGSTFTVRLPADDRVPASVLRTARVGAVSRNVMLVDDNEDAAMLLADLLRRRGYQVVVANDAESALRCAVETPPEIAVVDIGLPRIDGYQLARELRVVLGERAPQLIALTGYTQDHDRERSAAAGFHAHLSKPVDSATLLRTIEHVAATH